MNNFRPLTISRYFAALSFAAVLIGSIPSVRADTWDKKTTVSFSQAVEVPGAVLQPGKYVMKLVDLAAERHVVQFMNERQNHVFAAAMAIPTYRDRVTDYTAIAFYEAPAGQPEAIKTWFYPGDNYGQEFLYPKGRGGTRLAGFTSTTDTSLNTRNETKVNPEPTPEPVSPPPAETAIVTPPEPAPEPIEIAQAAPPKQESAPVTAAPPAPAPPTELPKTASNLPEIALLGLLSLAGAAAVRKVGRSVN